jgi:hypothetical protein
MNVHIFLKTAIMGENMAKGGLKREMPGLSRPSKVVLVKEQITMGERSLSAPRKICLKASNKTSLVGIN